MRADGPAELTDRLPVTAVYGLWLASWETALAALTTASGSGTLSASDAAAHRAVIAAEREIVTKQLTLLVDQGSLARAG